MADDPESCLVSNPFTVVAIHDETAEAAFSNVLNKAGASFKRDIVDQRIISETKNGTAEFGLRGDGIVDTQNDVGGWPELQTYNVKQDSDNDGMPDDWEEAKGLDPDDGKDHAHNTLHDHYTNIEVYLNELVEY